MNKSGIYNVYKADHDKGLWSLMCEPVRVSNLEDDISALVNSWLPGGLVPVNCNGSIELHNSGVKEVRIVSINKQIEWIDSRAILKPAALSSGGCYA